MENSHKESFSIKSYEGSANGQLSLVSLFHFLQEAASNHAHKLGVGYEHLTKKNFFWVLSRIKLEIEKMPEWGDTIHIKTWPKGVEKLFALRDFLVTDNSGNIIIRATSSWLLVDSLKYRLHRIEELGIVIPDNLGDYALNEVADKIQPLPGKTDMLEHTVYYGELDYNQHVNNCNYPGWLLDFYTPTEMSVLKLKKLQLNYLEEARFGDELEITNIVSSENTNIHYFEGVKKSNKSKVFQAVIHWQ